MEKLIVEVRINEYASRKHNANVPFSPARDLRRIDPVLAGRRLDNPLPCSRPRIGRSVGRGRGLCRDRPADPRQDRLDGNADAGGMDVAVARSSHEPHRRDGERPRGKARLRTDRYGHEQRRRLGFAAQGLSDGRRRLYESDEDLTLLRRDDS